MINNETVPFDFHIHAIENGWLFAGVDILGQHLALSNSYLGGLRLPKVLLQACAGILSGNMKSAWICWHGESQGQIWHMDRSFEQLHLEIYSIGSTFGLPVYGELLAKKVRSCTPMVCAVLDPFLFAQTVYDSFKEYGYGDALEQWNNSEFSNDFPKEELQELRRALRNGASSR